MILTKCSIDIEGHSSSSPSDTHSLMDEKTSSHVLENSQGPWYLLGVISENE